MESKIAQNIYRANMWKREEFAHVQFYMVMKNQVQIYKASIFLLNIHKIVKIYKIHFICINVAITWLPCKGLRSQQKNVKQKKT